MSLLIPYVIPDSIVWGLTEDGKYSDKSGVALLQGVEVRSGENVDFSWIRQLKVPLKDRFFIWRICQDGLPTIKRLEMSHVFQPQNCVFCNHHSEDADHLFFSGLMVQDVNNLLIEKKHKHQVP